MNYSGLHESGYVAPNFGPQVIMMVRIHMNEEDKNQSKMKTGWEFAAG